MSAFGRTAMSAASNYRCYVQEGNPMTLYVAWKVISLVAVLSSWREELS